MFKISGIGNGKNLIFKKINEKNKDTVLINYDVSHFKETVRRHDVLILVYDGICVEELFNIYESIRNIKFIPIFITTTNIYVFGINIENNSDNKDYVCPKCIARQTLNKSFKLKLYDFLIKQYGFKSIEESYGKELDHFTLLLLELIESNYLMGHVLNYSIVSNVYDFESFKGLSRCSLCDRTKYDNEDLNLALKEVL